MRLKIEDKLNMSQDDDLIRRYTLMKTLMKIEPMHLCEFSSKYKIS